jgi:hypothetical protein
MVEGHVTARLCKFESCSGHEQNAQVAELVDALHSGCSGRTPVQVRVLSWALKKDAGRKAGILLNSINLATMHLSRSGRIMNAFIVLFFMLGNLANAQCKHNQSVEGSATIRGIQNGYDLFYQNLIIQDIAIAGQLTFQEITLNLDFKVSFIADYCRPGFISIDVLPVGISCEPIFYQGYNIAPSIIPETADLVFNIAQPNGLVTDSLTFTGIPVNDTLKLYSSLNFQYDNLGTPVAASFAHAVFHYSSASYEKFRDYLLKIDDYYAACMLADSALTWTQSGFLAENENYADLITRQAELQRILDFIRPSGFDSLFCHGQGDVKSLHSDYSKLNLLDKRYKAIIGYKKAGFKEVSSTTFQNDLLPEYLNWLDYYYFLAYNTDFHYVNFLNKLSEPSFNNSRLINYYQSLNRSGKVSANTYRKWQRILVQVLLERGDGFAGSGNQPRALTFYNVALQTSLLLKLNDYQDIAEEKAGKMNEEIASSFLEISKKGVERDNPALAAQYFTDAWKMFPNTKNTKDSPVWLREYEQWLYGSFESQAVKNLDEKNFAKALDYLEEIGSHCMVSLTYPCPEKFHEWMGAARQGLYLQWLKKAMDLQQAAKETEAEDILAQAVGLRMKAGYRIGKDLDESKLELIFRQKHYDQFYAEGLSYYNTGEYVTALYYFNKADNLERLGIIRSSEQLADLRQETARNIILGVLSNGRLMAWANDLESARNELDQAQGMIREYRFSNSDSLTELYSQLEQNVKRTKCDKIISSFNDLMSGMEKAESDSDYVLAYDLAGQAVALSMENISCRINDELAWYKKISLETFADFQEKEDQLQQLVHQSVPQYIMAYQDLKNYYYKHKLLDQGIKFAALPDRVLHQTDSAFLAGMVDHFIYLNDYNHALQVLQRIHELDYANAGIKELQKKLAVCLARRDASVPANDKPWEILESYTGHDNWYRPFARGYKFEWLKTTQWKLKFWPVFWKK